MGILRPSLVKSCIYYIEQLPSTAISKEKRECIIAALRKRVPPNPEKTDAEYKCAECGTYVNNAMRFCPHCGQRRKV